MREPLKRQAFHRALVPSNHQGSTYRSTAVQLTLFLIALIVLVPAVTPNQAMAGGFWTKTLFLARIGALLVIANVMLRRRSLCWADVGLVQPDWLRLLIAVTAGILTTLLFSALALPMVARAGLRAPDYSVFAPVKGNLDLYLFWLLPVSVGTAAFGEELIFRGFITDALRRLLGATGNTALGATLILQAMIFGGLHFYQGVGGMIIAGVTGFALGLTWLIAGRNLWPGIIVHALLDGSAMTMIYLGELHT